MATHGLIGMNSIYLNDYASVPALAAGLERYFTCYNRERPHQSLAYRTPAEVHWK
jgi:putative transposase